MQDYRYYYKHEAEQYSFIRIPKMLMTGELFAPLSVQAKILYIENEVKKCIELLDV